MRRVMVALLALASAIAGAWAQEPASIDEQRSAWRYRRDVTRPDGAEGRLWAVPLPPDVQARSQQGLRDLRLVDGSGREAAFLIHDDAVRRREQRWTGLLVEATEERRQQSSWTVDFGEPITFDRLELDVPGRGFSKRLSLERSADGVTWQSAGAGFWIFDREWQSETVHVTALDVAGLEARFVRLSADDGRSRPVSVTGVVAVRSDDLGGATWSEAVSLEPIASAEGRTRYRVPVADGHPVRRMALDADDPAFARRIRVLERTGDDEREAGAGLVYRLRLPDEEFDLDSREIDVVRLAGGGLVIEVVDGDNPPLANPQVRLSGPRTMLVTSTTADRLTLFYGNTVTRAAVYDLEQLRNSIALIPDYPVAALGPETENPRFRQPAPLAFVAARGAEVDASQWRFDRPVRVTGAEDLYTLVMPAADLARLRRDLGDLRMVDESNRQVPYVLEAGADVTHVTLTVEPAVPRQGRPQVSAYRLTTSMAGPGSDALRFSALRLRFAEAYFQRTAEVLVPRAGAPLGTARVAAPMLDLPQPTGATAAAWVLVALDDVPARELILEIADRDNAPLTLLQAQGVVRVPRLTFKAASGDYRLLLGNPDAAPPSYELGGLRREVLAYSAVPLTLDADEMARPNPAYERSVTDLLRDAPPRAVLWTALGVALVVLLALTRGILKRTS